MPFAILGKHGRSAPAPYSLEDPLASGSTFTSNARYCSSFHSDILTTNYGTGSNDRRYWVALPAEYATQPSQRFGVLYMGDGDKMFDQTLADGLGTVEWQVDEAQRTLTAAGTIPPLIIVATEVNAGNRYYDYGPTLDPVVTQGGHADWFLRMMVEELKPRIDSKYRTLTDQANTGIGGSSMGGLFAAYAGRMRWDTYGKIMCMSGSFGFTGPGEDHAETNRYSELAAKLPTKIWVDKGSLEASTNQQLFYDTLIAKGWTANTDAKMTIGSGQAHNDSAWQARMPAALTWLYG